MTRGPVVGIELPGAELIAAEQLGGPGTSSRLLDESSAGGVVVGADRADAATAAPSSTIDLVVPMLRLQRLFRHGYSETILGRPLTTLCGSADHAA